MSFPTLTFLAFGLAMDAFAVSVSNGLCSRQNIWRISLSCAAAFGLFQGLMPLLGYWTGHTLGRWIARIGHWVAFLLLCAIGAKMILEARRNRTCDGPSGCKIVFGLLVAQAFATSIDALAVGVGLGVIAANPFLSVAVITAVTFLCCLLGAFAGRRFGNLLRGKAEALGGAVLILIGFHIFLEHSRYFFY